MTAFLSVFVTVFLAELGDKTQLATALFAADRERSPWLVFLASSAALVVSAGAATLLGGFVRDIAAGPWLKLAAAAGFIVIGAWMAWDALKPS